MIVYIFVYMGQTFVARFKQHQQAVFTGKREKSALAEHTLETGHEIEWANATILTSCSRTKDCMWSPGTSMNNAIP